MVEMECNGVQLTYQQAGEGEPVVLIHGWTMSQELWRQQVPALAKSHRVITYDLRGHGRSEKPAAGPYDLPTFAKDLERLLAGLGVERTALVGWSMGASVAVAFAAQHPERVRRLVLVAGTPLLVAKPDFPHALPPEQARAFAERLSQDYGEAMRAFVDMMLPDSDDAELRRWIHGVTQQTNGQIAAAILEIAGTTDTRPWVRGVSVPTLVLHGERDSVCLPDAARYYAETIPDARLHLFEGAGHCPFLTQAEAFNRELIAFLSA